MSICALKATQDTWRDMTLRGLIKSIRLSEGYSQADFGSLISRSGASISLMEAGITPVSLTLISLICNVLGYSEEPFLELYLREHLIAAELHDYTIKLEKKSC